jgi:hypothetical protein
MRIWGLEDFGVEDRDKCMGEHVRGEVARIRSEFVDWSHAVELKGAKEASG